jgi:hypothetical protein
MYIGIGTIVPERYNYFPVLEFNHLDIIVTMNLKHYLPFNNKVE